MPADHAAAYAAEFRRNTPSGEGGLSVEGLPCDVATTDATLRPRAARAAESASCSYATSAASQRGDDAANWLASPGPVGR